MKTLIISLVMFAFVFAQDLEMPQNSMAVASSLLTEEVAIGDTARIQVYFNFKGNPMLWAFDTLMPPSSMGMQFIGYKTSTVTDKNETGIFGQTTIELRFTPDREGKLSVSPWSWRMYYAPFGDTTQIDTMDMHFDEFVMKGLPKRFRLEDYTAILIIVIGLIFLAIIGFFVFKFIKKSKEKPIEPPRPPTPEEKAIAQLDKLSVQRHKTEDIIDKIAKITRIYISERFGFNAQGMTSKEIMAAMSDLNIGGNRIVSLQEVLKFCDDVRFAEKYPETKEITLIIEQARSFITG